METLLTLCLLGAIAVLMLLDLVAPARAFPEIRFWRLRGLLGFVVFLGVATFGPLLWDEALGQYRLVDATSLGPWWGAVVGILALQLVVYWWHRALHRVPFLWRHFHQLHHSAERVDVFGGYWFHPFDMVGFTLAGSFALVFLVGVSPEAALIANTFVGFCAAFQHANLRTPRWLGFLIQRPENHAVHHERDVHAFNYGDIPLWDMVFGTFRNPKAWNGRAGFWNGASNRIGALLVGRDVSAPSHAASATTRECYRERDGDARRLSAR
jgi:sterol desaturase/sphingolipid hydroxylase (fatty acid hydroxylase superfamily)